MCAFLSLRSRFLLSNKDGYHVSGELDIGVEHLLYSYPVKQGEALRLYATAISRNTILSIPQDASIQTLAKRTTSSLIPYLKPINDSLERRLCLFTKHELACFKSCDLTVGEAVSCFIDPEALYAGILLTNTAGEVLRNDGHGLRYFIRSREQGHHKLPHVHVCYRNTAHGVVCILDGKILAGDLPTKAAGVASQRVLENQGELLRYWNERTNGMEFDPNVLLGGTPIVGTN